MWLLKKQILWTKICLKKFIGTKIICVKTCRSKPPNIWVITLGRNKIMGVNIKTKLIRLKKRAVLSSEWHDCSSLESGPGFWPSLASSHGYQNSTWRLLCNIVTSQMHKRARSQIRRPDHKTYLVFILPLNDSEGTPHTHNYLDTNNHKSVMNFAFAARGLF